MASSTSEGSGGREAARPLRSFWRRGLLGATGAWIVFAGLVTHWSGDLGRRSFTSNFYDLQAIAFLHGHVQLPRDVLSVEAFTVHGRSSMYYGPFLAIVRMPLMVVAPSLAGRTTEVSMLLAVIALSFVALSLLRRAMAEFGAPAGTLARVAPGSFAVAVVAGSTVLYLAGFPSVYAETELWGVVLCLATFRLAIAVLDRPTVGSALLLGASAGATYSTRAALGLGAIAVAIAVAGISLRSSRRASSGSTVARWSIPTATVGLTTVGVAVSAAVNAARFGTLFSVPVRAQAIATDGLSAMEMRFVAHHSSFTDPLVLPSTLVRYLRPDGVDLSSLVPFVNFPSSIGVLQPSRFEGLNPASTVPASMPFLLLAAFLGLAALLQ